MFEDATMLVWVSESTWFSHFEAICLSHYKSDNKPVYVGRTRNPRELKSVQSDTIYSSVEMPKSGCRVLEHCKSAKAFRKPLLFGSNRRAESFVFT